jgi:hypothetical protein
MARTKRTTRKATPATRLASTIGTVRSALVSGAGVARNRASGAISQLERVLQSRVSSVASKLGVPRAAEVRALTRQVAQLQQSVDKLSRARARS